ncbi:MAG TPA: heme o synthase [Myxococcaceae bacterium]
MSERAVVASGAAADLLSLTKPRLSALVLATAAGGMWLAPGHLSVARALLTLLATAGTVGAANALNCWWERDSDRFMARTRRRPLPAGRMEPAVALWFGIGLAAICLPALALSANLLTGALGLLAFASYVFVYTPMKARSSAAMLVGAVPGALPPLMGWTAVSGAIELGGLALFALLFVWQLPHTVAIGIFRREEYEAAGLKSLPIERGEAVSRAHILVYLTVLWPVAVAPYFLGVAGRLYLVAAVALGAALFGLGAWGVVKRLGRPWARQLFLASLLYLSAIFLVLMVDGGIRRA